MMSMTHTPEWVPPVRGHGETIGFDRVTFL